MRRIAAMGGGGFSMEPRNRRLDAWLLSLTRRRRPRVLFLPTASGDSPDYIARFHRAFSRFDCKPAHLALFNRTIDDLRTFILSTDLIYVGGGNTASMMAVWRAHGVDAILREAWEQGRVLCGLSAGAICWFESGLTDSFGTRLQPLRSGLGFLSGSFCPHYDGEPRRRPVYRRAIASKALLPGFAADDGAALLFEDSHLVEVVTSRPHARGYRVESARERELPARLLPRP